MTSLCIFANLESKLVNENFSILFFLTLSFCIFIGLKKSHVKLKVTGDIHEFRPIDAEGFRQMIAEQCGEDIIYVCDIGKQEGCVLLHFQVPEECKKYLISSYKDLQAWCLEYGVTKVCVDGKDIVSLSPFENEHFLKCKSFFLIWRHRKFQLLFD